jgi:uncharacterized iron-regulated membrane protein
LSLRKYHRWFSSVGMILLTWLVISGTVLAFDEIIDREQWEAPIVAPPTLPEADLERLASSTVRAALATRYGDATPLHAARLQLHIVNGKTVGTVSFAGDGVNTVAFDANTGTPLASRAPGARREGARPLGSLPLNAILQDLHSGAIVGPVGQWFIIATGLTLTTLAVTGIWLYLQMWQARRKIKRGNWFWK